MLLTLHPSQPQASEEVVCDESQSSNAAKDVVFTVLANRPPTGMLRKKGREIVVLSLAHNGSTGTYVTNEALQRFTRAR